MVQGVELVKLGTRYHARVKCVICRVAYDVPVKFREFTAWQRGVCVQDAMPNTTPDARELLASGTCPVCWNKMFKRVVVMGWPKSGKSAYASVIGSQLGLRPRATDELKDLPWSRQSEVVCEWLDEDGPWIIEGVVVVRALRKWKERNPGEAPPVDEIIVMPKPALQDLTEPQIIMGKGHDTILLELVDWFAEHVRSVKEVTLERN